MKPTRSTLERAPQAEIDAAIEKLREILDHERAHPEEADYSWQNDLPTLPDDPATTIAETQAASAKWAARKPATLPLGKRNRR